MLFEGVAIDLRREVDDACFEVDAVELFKESFIVSSKDEDLFKVIVLGKGVGLGNDVDVGKDADKLRHVGLPNGVALVIAVGLVAIKEPPFEFDAIGLVKQWLSSKVLGG